MPIHDVGYRPWKGRTTSLSSRWLVITLNGIRLALKSRWNTRLLFAAWLPVMYWAGAFFVVEKAIEQNYGQNRPGLQEAIEDVQDNPTVEQVTEEAADLAVRKELKRRVQLLPNFSNMADVLDSDDPQVVRREVWRWLLMTFFRYPQGFTIVFLVGLVAPALISRDIRSRAFLLYFSKPIGKIEYLIGKLMIPAAFIAAVTTLPALVLFLFAVLMSPDLSVLLVTWDIPIRILVSTIVLIVPTASLALMLSSLTQESRFSTFAWFAVWILGHGAYFAVMLATTIRLQADEPFSQEVMDTALVQGASNLSLYNCLGSVQGAVFGIADWNTALLPGGVLLGVTVFSWFVLYRRVSSPIRI